MRDQNFGRLSYIEIEVKDFQQARLVQKYFSHSDYIDPFQYSQAQKEITPLYVVLFLEKKTSKIDHKSVQKPFKLKAAIKLLNDGKLDR